jgi:hypothetical protein
MWILLVTLILSILWSVALVLFGNDLGLTDYQAGYWGGTGFFYIWIVGITVRIVVFIVKRIRSK